MKRYFCSSALAIALAMVVIGSGNIVAADKPVKVEGTWEVSIETPNGARTNTLKIQQDGEKIKGTMTGRMGETPIEGTVSGNTLKFTLTRETPNGTFTIEYTGTVDGDNITGTTHSERFDGKFTAKRSTGEAQK